MIRPTQFVGNYLLFFTFSILLSSGVSCPVRNLCIQNPIERRDRPLSFFDQIYCGCQHILGSLTIRLDIDSPILENSNFSFLSQLEEVTDHILFQNVKISRLVIPSLRIVGGKNPVQVTFPNQVQNYAILFSNCTIDQIILPQLTYIESNTVGVQIDTSEDVSGSDIFKALLDRTTGCNLYGVNWREVLRKFSIVFRVDVQSPASVLSGTVILDLPSDCNQTSIMSECNGCMGGACWNQTECQVLTSSFSGQGCGSCVVESGCYDFDLGTCCNNLCLGGCSGPGLNQCYGCSQFDNNNTCVSECPPRFIFNPITFASEPNPAGRFALDKFCVLECPVGYIEFEDKECVERCPDTYTAVTQGDIQTCEFCGSGCPIECDGTDLLTNARFNGSTAHLFKNCTRVNGDFKINSASYSDGVTENDLRYLEDITEITGVLNIVGTPASINIFTFFGNLTIIRGNGVGTSSSLLVAANKFEYIDLSQLQTVSAGRITFAINTNLCYLANLTVYRPENQTNPNTPSSYPNNPNCTCDDECEPLYRCWGPNPEHCVRCRNFIHDRSCVRNCSGITKVYSDFDSKTCQPCNAQCLNSCTDATAFTCDACKNFKNDNECVKSCPTENYSNEEKTCIQCNSVCTLNCTGPNTTISEGGCDLCERIVLDDNGNQVGCIQGATCPALSFERLEVVANVIPASNDTTNNINVCRPCHPLCQTCSGNQLENCLSCRFFNGTNGVCVETCNITTEYGTQGECRACNQECIGCTGQSARDCLRCKNVNHQGECLDICPLSTYPDSNDNCSPCHSSCETCQEAGEYRCTSCGLTTFLTNWATNNATCTSNCFEGFYTNERNCSRCAELCRVCTSLEDCTSCRFAQLENETCVSECPDNFELDERGIFCTPNSINSIVENLDRFKYPILAAFGFGIFLIICTISGFFICIFAYLRYIKSNKIKVKEELENPTYGVLQNGNAGMEMNTMMSQSTIGYSLMRAGSQDSIVEADMTQLAIADLSSIEKQAALGKGAFGIVYRGIWKPKEGEEIVVAIKELNEDAPIEDMQELIKEAVLLAKMRHRYLVQFYCLCMARQLMIINELVPGGSLLDYLKKERLTSKTRLTFMQQIASGMNYLESRRLVHRDLAARNCLVASNELVKISDFGLSRILEVGKDQYISSGGKIPVRWMPLESIFYKHYSHNSDVWSYGVTAWEILTSAKRPYGNIKPQEVIELLVAGERLQQPANCSIVLYRLLKRCWIDKPDDRISFEELKTQLQDMFSEAELFVFPSEDEGTKFGSSGYSTIPDYEEIDEEMMAYLVTTQVQLLVRDAINGKKGTMNYENLRDHKSQPLLQERGTEMADLAPAQNDEQGTDNYMTAGVSKISMGAKLDKAEDSNPYSLAEDILPSGIEIFQNYGAGQTSPPESGTVSDYLLADDLTRKLKESTSFSNPYSIADDNSKISSNSKSKVTMVASDVSASALENEYMLSNDVTDKHKVNEYLVTRLSSKSGGTNVHNNPSLDQQVKHGNKSDPTGMGLNTNFPNQSSNVKEEIIDLIQEGHSPTGYLDAKPDIDRPTSSEYLKSKHDPTSLKPSQYLQSTTTERGLLPSEYLQSTPKEIGLLPSEYIQTTQIEKGVIPSEYLDSKPELLVTSPTPSEYLQSTPTEKGVIPSEYLQSTPSEKGIISSEYLQSTPTEKGVIPSEYLQSTPTEKGVIPSEYLQSTPTEKGVIPSEYLQSTPSEKGVISSEYLQSTPTEKGVISSEYLQSTPTEKGVIPSEYLQSTPTEKGVIPSEYLQSTPTEKGVIPSEYLQSTPSEKGVIPSEYLQSTPTEKGVIPSEYLQSTPTEKGVIPTEYLQSTPSEIGVIPSEYIAMNQGLTSQTPSGYLESNQTRKGVLASEYLESTPIEKKITPPSEYLNSNPSEAKLNPTEYWKTSGFHGATTEYLDPNQESTVAGGYANQREQDSTRIPLQGNASDYVQSRLPGKIEMDEYQYMEMGSAIKSPNRQNLNNEQHYETTIVKSAEHSHNPEQSHILHEYEDVDGDNSLPVHEYSEPDDILSPGVLKETQLSQSNSDKNEYEYIDESKRALPSLMQIQSEPHYATGLAKTGPKQRKFSLEEDNPLYGRLDK